MFKFLKNGWIIAQKIDIGKLIEKTNSKPFKTIYREQMGEPDLSTMQSDDSDFQDSLFHSSKNKLRSESSTTGVSDVLQEVNTIVHGFKVDNLIKIGECFFWSNQEKV